MADHFLGRLFALLYSKLTWWACAACQRDRLTTLSVGVDGFLGDVGSGVSRSSGSSDSEGGSPANEGVMGDYQKLQVLGRGRFGKVQLCERTSDGQLFALKSFRKPVLERQRHWDADASAYRSALELVKGEIAIMQELKHPHVVQLHDVVDTAESLHLVIDYVPGGPLMGSPTDSRLRYWTPLSEPRACALLRDIVCGLQYLHDHGVIHQDLKPDNILLDADGRARIADFGVARMHVLSSSHLRLDGSDLGVARMHMLSSSQLSLESSDGTPAFRAPETYQQGRHCGRAADVWSLGRPALPSCCLNLTFHPQPHLTLISPSSHPHLTFILTPDFLTQA